MIEFKNISKKFSNQVVLDNVNFSLPRFGLAIINGPSGCGKSTLLNIVSTLLNFEGDIIFDGKSYSSLTKNEKEMIRSKKIGFVFQDYKLFEFESVKNNILLSLNMCSNESESKKNKKVTDLLKLVGLYNKDNELVSNLSGGEKQRVAIARALANSPSILLADEPTGNLDEKNTDIVMNLLHKISVSSLVLMVSHDKEITEKYADQIIEMKDGKVINIKYKNKKRHKEHLPIIKLKYGNKRHCLSFKFLFSHTINSILRRKWRTMFISLSTSLGLIGVGLASTLSDIVSKNLYKSYSSIIDTNKLVVSNKSNSYIKDEITSATYNEVSEIMEDNNQDIKSIGVYYWNIPYLFPSDDYLALDSGGAVKPFGSFSSRHINEFQPLDSVKETMYPSKINAITNDEVVLSMPALVVNELCYQLQISRSVKSLSNHIDHHEVNVCFTFSNENWGYSIEIPLRLRGFVLSSEQLIYHSNPYWNEHIFENKCHLPSTSYVNVNSLHPWDLIKSYYLSFSRNRDSFLATKRFDIESNDFDFEILDDKYYPLSVKENETYDCSRVMVIKRTHKDNVPSFIGEYAKQRTKDVNKIIYGTSTGYSIYEQSLMIGFSKSTYLSYSKDDVLDAVDLMSYIKYEDSFNVHLPQNLVEGHYSKSSTDGFIFEPSYQLIKGREPINYQEILLSESLLEKLQIPNPLNKIFYLSFPIKEELLANGYLSRDYKTVGLKITGITSNSKLSISHNEAWSILFFQTMLGVSTFELNINNLALEITEGKENQIIDKITRAFPQLEITAPLKDVKESVDRICSYIEIIMLAVSITSVIIAVFILFICNYLHFMEAKKDIGLVRCLGVKETESRKFIYFHSIVMTMMSLILSTIELLVVAIVLSKSMSKILSIESSFVFNPMSLVYMSLVAIGISLLSSIFISLKTRKIDPLDCLK